MQNLEFIVYYCIFPQLLLQIIATFSVVLEFFDVLELKYMGDSIINL